MTKKILLCFASVTKRAEEEKLNGQKRKKERKNKDNIQGLSEIMETPENFKLILIWFSVCNPPVKSGFVQLPSYSFSETGFSRWTLSSAVIFRAVLLWSFQTIRVTVSPTVPIRQFSLFSRVLLQWGGFFPLFLNVVITFETFFLAILNNSAVFVTLAPTIRAPAIWHLFESDRYSILMNFDLFLLILSVKKQQF